MKENDDNIWRHRVMTSCRFSICSTSCICTTVVQGENPQDALYLLPSSWHPEEFHYVKTMSNTHADTRTHITQHASRFIWGLRAHVTPSNEEWSQSESRWEVRPGVQALHLSSVIKTAALGPSHPTEEKMERRSADPGLLTQAGDCWSVTDHLPRPICTYLWNT